jgi:hypothetical protein
VCDPNCNEVCTSQVDVPSLPVHVSPRTASTRRSRDPSHTTSAHSRTQGYPQSAWRTSNLCNVTPCGLSEPLRVLSAPCRLLTSRHVTETSIEICRLTTRKYPSLSPQCLTSTPRLSFQGQSESRGSVDTACLRASTASRSTANCCAAEAGTSRGIRASTSHFMQRSPVCLPVL